MNVLPHRDKDKDLVSLERDIRHHDEDVVAAQKAIDRADRWLEAVFRDADKVFQPSRKRARGTR